ncbi:MAG: BAX inhibitor (BI)-1/YccA family protein, partial [Gammaproteobacteria bacterium]|nr:BAX inhibitor (BI)-1/YccA family protein [Gammaproteobacteria bacterium]
MNRYENVIAHGSESAVSSNKVLKNTYLLLSATLGFSALMALVSMAIGVPPMAYLVAVIAAMVLGIFVLPRTANSTSGIGVIFLIT